MAGGVKQEIALTAEGEKLTAGHTGSLRGLTASPVSVSGLTLVKTMEWKDHFPLR